MSAPPVSSLYALSSTELSSIYLSLTSMSPLLQLVALLVAYRWAEAFEPLLERWSPELHTRRLDENILPNPRQGAPGGPPKEGETYTYSALPIATEGSPGGGHHPPLSSRASTARTRALETFASYRSSQSGIDGLPTTYDYEVLQQQIRSHTEQQQREQQQQHQEN